MIDFYSVTMNSAAKKSSSDESGSGSPMNPKYSGFARVLEPARVDHMHSKLLGWDFRELAAFLRAQDDDWVQHTGV